MIILVKIDAHTEQKYIPYGLLYIGNSLEKAGYEVEILHNTYLHSLTDDLKEFKRVIERSNPLFIGFSVNTGRSTTLSADLSETVKNDVGDIPIVWGGVHPTILPRQCLSESYVDIVVLEDGEETVVELAQALEAKLNLSGVKGIGYKQNGHPVINPLRPKTENLDAYKPAWHLIDVKRYLNKCRVYRANYNRVLSYVTSRGCPYRCAFCHNMAGHNQHTRYHSLERVTSDLKQLEDEHNVDAVWFNDDNLFVNQKRAFTIIEETGLPWFGEARVNYMINEKFVEQLEKTNCICVMSGAESGSDRVLQYIKKDITVAQTEKATELLAKHHVPLSHSFIIGFPGETWTEIIQTTRFIHKLDGYYRDNLDLFHPKLGIYLPYPGTPLYKVALDKGFQPPTNTRDWAKLDYRCCHVGFDLPWVNQQKLSNLLTFYSYAGRTRINRRPDLKIVEKIFKHRLEKDNFSFPFDIMLYSFIREKIAGIIRFAEGKHGKRFQI